MEVVRDQLHEGQCQLLAQAAAETDDLRCVADAVRLLVIIRYRGTRQDDQPVNVYPYHEDDEDGKAGIDGGIVGRVNDEGSKDCTGYLPAQGRR